MNRRAAAILAVAVTVAVTGSAAVLLAGGAASLAPSPSPTGSQGPGMPAVLGQIAPDPRPWDGIAWRPLRTEGFALEPGQHVGRIVATGTGLLAIGQGPNPRPNPDGLTSTLTAWRSGDGVRWIATPVLAGVGAGSVGEAWNVAAGPGGVVIAGNVCCREEGPAIWWSRDGAEWQRAAVPRLPETWLTGAAAGHAGFVVIGTSRGTGVIWTSEDGLEWRPVDPDAAGLVRGELAHAIATADGFLVAGMDDEAGRDSQAAVWASRGLDGWHRVAESDRALAGPDEASMTRLVPFANGLFATGGSGTQEDRIACEGALEGGVRTAGPATGPATAFSCGWLREMTWRSADGTAWERIDPWGPDGTYPPEPVPPTNRAPATWDHIVAAGPGLVGVLVELIGGQHGPAGDVLGVWTSADARTWRRIADGPPGAESIVGIVALDRAVYVLGDTGTAWLGTALP